MFYKTLGILGGGQLGRMSALAAAELGISVVIYTPEENSPASHVSYKTIVASYEDRKALKEFADAVDVITYEFENIPVQTVEFLCTYKNVYPEASLLEISQDRISEKSFLNSIGIKTAKWAPVESVEDVHTIQNLWKTYDLILKTTRFGYDGKGQVRLTENSDIIENIERFRGQPLIAESLIDFAHEVSVIVARDTSGHTVTYGPMVNDHKNHILSKTSVPYLNNKLSNQAVSMAKKVADEIQLIGVMTLEMFVTKTGEILANEIAPRTHNSGHWTIDGCSHSQFENHVRSVCGLPVLNYDIHGKIEMINLIGEDVNNLQKYLSNPKAHIHIYGKKDVQAGRKMGHVTIIHEQ